MIISLKAAHLVEFQLKIISNRAQHSQRLELKGPGSNKSYDSVDKPPIQSNPNIPKARELFQKPYKAQIMIETKNFYTPKIKKGLVLRIK